MISTDENSNQQSDEDRKLKEDLRQETEKQNSVDELAGAFELLPIREQLQYVQSVICLRSQDEHGNIQDYNLAVAAAILRISMRVLGNVRTIEDLRGPG